MPKNTGRAAFLLRRKRCGKRRVVTEKSSERPFGIDANRVYFAPISSIPKLNQSGSVITAAIDVASTICTAIFG